MLLLAAFATESFAATDPLLECEAAKLAAAGKKAAADLKCHAKAVSKGEAVDASCLSKAALKFTAAFQKAEQAVVCAEPGDAATVEATVDTFTAAIVTTLPPGPGGAKCAAKKLKAAGKKTSALLKAFASDTKKPDPDKLSAAVLKAEQKLDSTFAKEDAKGDCNMTEDALAITNEIDDFVGDLVGIVEPICPDELLYSPEDNRLRRYDLDTVDDPPLVEDILIEKASGGGGREFPGRMPAAENRDINGEVCALPDGSGGFVAGEDTNQPDPPPGWGVFDVDGNQIGKLAATYFTAQGEPFGCSFDSSGNLFTSEVGNQATGPKNGQLIMWFPPFDEFPGMPGEYPNTNDPSTNFCKIASNIGTAGAVAVDELDRVYVAASRDFVVLRYSPPFPTGPDAPGGCGGTDSLGSPVADSVNVEVFVADTTNLGTPSGIARAANGNWYISSVFTGRISEYDPDGNFVRPILDPPPDPDGELPLPTGHPQGIAVSCTGDIYYGDLDLVDQGGGIPGPGPDGKVRRITFDLGGNPRAPQIVRSGLRFPDGLGILEGDLESP